MLNALTIWQQPTPLAEIKLDGLVELLVWGVMAAIWLVAQLAAAKKKNTRAERSTSDHATTRPASQQRDSYTATADEIEDFFRQLSGQSKPKPSAPGRQQKQPAVKPAVYATAKRTLASQQSAPQKKQRMAPAPEVVPATAPMEGVAGVQGVMGPTGLSLPRMQALSCRLETWPSIPMPKVGFSRRTHPPIRLALQEPHSLRRAILAQTILDQPAGLRS